MDAIYTNATRKLATMSEPGFGNYNAPPEKINYGIFFKDIPNDALIGVFKHSVIGERGTCFYCEAKAETNRDHFYPKSKGGVLMVISCIQCNTQKGNLVPSKWIKKNERRNIKQEKRDIIISNTRKLLDKIINDGLEIPAKI